jgi:hypothetical protein
MKIAIVKAIIRWLFANYKWLLVETVIGHDCHVHRNPKKRVTV